MRRVHRQRLIVRRDHFCVVHWKAKELGPCTSILQLSESSMKTIAAILVLFVTGLPVAEPLLALDNASVPPCCRRTGKHHCMQMSNREANGSSVPALSSIHTKCPDFPQVLTSPVQARIGVNRSATLIAPVISRASLCSDTRSGSRTGLFRSHQKRGPPALSL